MATPAMPRVDVPLPAPTCADFWSRQPATGEGFNHDFEVALVALENVDRHEQGLPPLIANDALYSFAQPQAQYLTHSRTWSHPHTGPDGLDFAPRLLASGLVQKEGATQHIDTAGWLWGDAMENVFWGYDGLDLCGAFAEHSTVHQNNWRGFNADTDLTYPVLYQGTACYVIYATRTFTCVQDFVARQ